MMQGREKVPLRPLVPKKVVSVEEEKNQDTTGTRGRRVRELLRFVDQYYQLPEERSLKWAVFGFE